MISLYYMHALANYQTCIRHLPLFTTYAYLYACHFLLGINLAFRREWHNFQLYWLNMALSFRKKKKKVAFFDFGPFLFINLCGYNSKKKKAITTCVFLWDLIWSGDSFNLMSYWPRNQRLCALKVTRNGTTRLAVLLPY